MLYKYFRFTKKRIVTFCILMALILGLQIFFTGSLLARQKVVTEAGNAASAVIGVLDKTEIVRQKFKFRRKVVLSEFSLSFGSFERSEVGDMLNVQVTDGDNNILYESSVPVDDISPNASYRISMNHTITIPSGAVCCIKLSCSSEKSEYETIPTLNTTNKTEPNTYMSTLKMQTGKKSLNISYTYYYRQIAPMILMVLEVMLLFFLCFERVSEYGELLRKKAEKQERKSKREQAENEKAQEKRKQSKSAAAKVKYSKTKKQVDKKQEKRKIRYQKKHNKNRLTKTKKIDSFKDFLKWCLTEPKVLRNVRIFIYLFNPLLLMFAVELINDVLLTKSAWVWIFTWLLLLAVEYLLYAITGSMCIAMLVMDILFFLSGVANLILLNVRGTPFLPGDLLALGTAAEVSGTYQISLTPMQFVMIPAFILWCFLLIRLCKKPEKMTWKQDWRKKLVKRCTPAVVSVLTIGILYNTQILSVFKIEDNVWNKVASSRTNGFFMNFFLNLHYLSVSKPSGYSEERVKEILTELKQEKKKLPEKKTKTDQETGEIFTTNTDFSTVKTLGDKKPNIILIMNESLADYNLFAEPDYNKDPLAFLHSLKENTIYGKDYVSVYGAGTSNSEFEAMTGNTMKFFPSGSNVYQQFMHESTFSLPSYLKEMGYSTIAVHPSSGENWNRIKTYKSMKFDRFITIKDFKNPEYVRYISDKESYKKVIEVYEQKEKGTPLYCFDMTIQNHGGYLTNTNWKNPIYVKGSYYQEAKEFLSATKVSDDAFKYLVDYFKKQEEPTIICMFGDHQPSIEMDFYEEIMKKSEDDWTLQDIQKRYITPFIIWANYDIEESRNAVISNNYIENLLLKQAGIDLPVYNQFIEKVSGTVPAMNVNGYMDDSGVWHNYNNKEQPDDVTDLLSKYELLQYAYYSDSNKKETGALFQMKE